MGKEVLLFTAVKVPIPQLKRTIKILHLRAKFTKSIEIKLLVSQDLVPIDDIVNTDA